MLTAEQNQLVTDHLRVVDLAVERAFRSRPETPAYTREDARQDGYLAIVVAARDYRTGSSATFATYANHRVFGAILDGFRRLDPLTRNDRRLVREAGGPVRVERDGKLVDIVAPITVSLDERAPGTTQTRQELLADTLADDTGKLADLRRIVRPLVRDLPAPQAYVIWRVFFEDALHADVARALGVTPSRISQLVAAAANTIRAQLALEAA